MGALGNVSLVEKSDSGNQTLSLGKELVTLLEDIGRYTMPTKEPDETNVSAVPQIGRTQSLNEVDGIHAEFGNVGGIVKTIA